VKEIAMSLARFAIVACIAFAWASLNGGCAANDAATPSNSKAPTALALAPDSPKWNVTMDNIEACSCPAFCQCYFTGQPALHQEHAQDHVMRYCRFSNGFRITKGQYGDQKLDGLTFWMAGDLGGDFSKGEMDWAVLHFEPSATPAQRAGVEAIVKAIFPVKWNSFTTGADAKIEWNKTADGAVAKLNGGKSGEIVLNQVKGDDGKPVKINNVKFWAAPKNSGFLVMKNEVEAYREGAKPFEFKGSNGFFTTIEMSSADTAKAAGAASVQEALARAGDCCTTR
jgi:hypothetical protein